MSAWRATAAAGFVFAYEAAVMIHGGDRKRALLDGSVQRARAEYLRARDPLHAYAAAAFDIGMAGIKQLQDFKLPLM